MEIELPGGAILEMPDGATPEAIKTAVGNYRASPDFAALVDSKTGAPAKVRMLVGSSGEKDKLANLQRFYPDAVPYGADNYVFTDPNTNRPTLFNPKGMDVGDAAEFTKAGVQAVGASLGAAAGSAVGPAGTIAGAGLGTATAGSLFDIAANEIAGRIDTRNIAEASTDVALDVAGGSIGQRAGELLEIGAKAVAGAGRRGAETIAQSFRNLGVNPPAGAASGSNAVQAVEHALANAPGSASIMQRASEAVMGRVREVANQTAAQFGPIRTPQGAGETIRTAARNAANRFEARQGKLYDAAFDLVGADTRVPVAAVTKLRGELEAELGKAAQSRSGVLKPAIDKLKQLETDAGQGGIPFSALRHVRTDIGRDLDNPVLAGSTSSQNAAMRRVYGALTEDMGAASRSAGPDAEKAVALADRYTRRNMTQLMPALQKIEDLGADEKAFKFAMDTTREGGTKLATLRRAFTPEEWDTVAGTVLGRMGSAKPGAQDAAGEAFSANTFLTNWNSMAPEARAALFGGRRYEGLAPELDRLVKVVGALKDTEKMANPSGTARQIAQLATVSALGGSLGMIAGGADVESGAAGVAGAIVAPAVAAKLITSPSFVRWLTSSATAATKPNGLTAHLTRLAAIGKAEPEIREEIGQYLDALRASPAHQTAQ